MTIHAVEVTPDYAHAKVYFTVIGSPAQDAMDGLNAAAGHLHNLLFKRLRIHKKQADSARPEARRRKPATDTSTAA